MKKALLIILSAFIFMVRTHSQVTIKKDLVAYYDQLPSMPTSLQDAYDKCRCNTNGCTSDSLVAPLSRSMQSDAKSMSTLSTANAQNVQNGKTLAQKVQADNVNGMNNNQKLDYVKNNSDLNGGNPNAVAFAQKMQDPAEKAKLQAMTPAEKIAYLQQNGMLGAAPTGMPSAIQSATVAPAPADDPKIDSALSKEQQMQSNTTGTDRSKLSIALERETDMTALDSAHDVLNKHQNAAVADVEKTGSGSANAAAIKALNDMYLQKHLQLATTELQNMTNAYNALLAFLKTAEAPFSTALGDAGYGYASDGKQDDNITKFSSGQTIILTDVGRLADYVKTIYNFAAGWQYKQVQASSTK